MKKRKAKRVAKAIVAYLFQDSERLVLEPKGEHLNASGWGRGPVLDAIVARLRKGGSK